MRLAPVCATWTAVAVVASSAAAAPPTPITQGPTSNPPPAFLGAPATPRPLSYAEAPTPPRHPFMAANDRSNIHDDAYQTDTANGPGPLGRDVQVLSTSHFADCASVTFDQRGRIVTVCVGVSTIKLKLFDPRTLEELANFDLPPRNSGANTFTDFSGGGYFYLDQLDRAIIPTTQRHLLVVGHTDGQGFGVRRDYDLTSAIPADDKIIAVMPDWSGRIWAVSVKGIVATIDPAGGGVQTVNTGEPIGNSFAVDETGGVFIVTDGALYRFDAGPGGAPKVTWREAYANTQVKKPGQTQAGSGTTPTLMGREFVSITDNADPMNVVILRRARAATPRRVCTRAVFGAGRGATDNSLIGTARSVVVENNYGYLGPQTLLGGATEPGVERVDIDRGDRSCSTAWHSDERSPTLVPKLSLENGLVYLYTKDPDPTLTDPFYLTALDFRTGRTVWKRHAGNGLGFNNNYAPVTLGPEGSAYVGVLGGMVLLRDRVPPARVTRPGAASAGATRRPALALGLYGMQTPRRARARCANRSFAAIVTGPDRRAIRRVDFVFRLRRVRRDTVYPFKLFFVRRALRTGNGYRVRAIVTMRDGRVRTLTRFFRAC